MAMQVEIASADLDEHAAFGRLAFFHHQLPFGGATRSEGEAGLVMPFLDRLRGGEILREGCAHEEAEHLVKPAGLVVHQPVGSLPYSAGSTKVTRIVTAETPAITVERMNCIELGNASRLGFLR